MPRGGRRSHRPLLLPPPLQSILYISTAPLACLTSLVSWSILLVLFTLLYPNSILSTSSAMMMCPTPEPCHCIGNDIIYCAFKRLTKLPYFLDFYEVWDQLNLSENLLRNLTAEGFNGIKVRTLDLTRNAISKIDPNAFKGIENLYVLDLSHNQLASIPKTMLGPLVQLRTLKLRYNYFTKINKNAFAEVPQLKELDLSGNDLTEVPSAALAPLVNLKKLWLRNNKIQIIKGFAFPHIPLEFLDLGMNDSPVRMEPSALCGLRPTISHAEPNVKEWSGMHTLLMDHNGLSHLDPCIAKMIWTLQTVDISGNALRCDCRLYLLKVWGIRTTFPHAQCATPMRLASEYVDRLDKYKFNCSKSDTIRRCEAMCPAPTPPTNAAHSARHVTCDFHFLFLVSWIIVAYCKN